MLLKLAVKFGDAFYFIFRVLIGLLFFMHGMMKFGYFGGKAVESLVSMMGAAEIIEVIVGPLILLGLFTRLAALVGAGEMVVAYATVHWPQGLNPLANQGELAVLYFIAFLVLLTYGAKRVGLEKTLFKKELF